MPEPSSLISVVVVVVVAFVVRGDTISAYERRFVVVVVVAFSPVPNGVKGWEDNRTLPVQS